MVIPAVIAHGGAGPGPARQDNLQVAIKKAAEILIAGGTALDAAVQACVILENDPVFNAGTGSVMRTDKFSMKSLMIFGTLLCGLGIASLPYVPASASWIVFFSSAALAIGNALFSPTQSSRKLVSPK